MEIVGQVLSSAAALELHLSLGLMIMMLMMLMITNFIVRLSIPILVWYLIYTRYWMFLIWFIFIDLSIDHTVKLLTLYRCMLQSIYENHPFLYNQKYPHSSDSVSLRFLLSLLSMLNQILGAFTSKIREKSIMQYANLPLAQCYLHKAKPFCNDIRNSKIENR